jgi:hypothetical protein
MELLFEHGFSEGVLVTLDTIAILVEDAQQTERKAHWLNEKKTILVGRCLEGSRYIPCIKERRIQTFFGFTVSRKDRVLVLVDNMLHVRDPSTWSHRFPEVSRRLRAAFYDESIADIARDELAKLAKQVDATLEYKDCFHSAGA